MFIRRSFIFVVALILFKTGVYLCHAQQTNLGKILGLSFAGNKTSDVGTIKLSSGLREGEEAAWENIQQAVKNLWALGIFSNIQIIMTEKTTEGVFLTIKVEEYPKMARLDIEGNKKIKTEDIEKEMTLFRGQVISPGRIARAKKMLKQMYIKKGYTLVEIDSKTYESEKEGRMILRFVISEGKKVQIKKIRFFGNTVFKEGKLRKQFKETKEDRWWRGADFKKEAYAEDKEKVLGFYRNHGYRDAEILKDSLYYDAEKKDMFIDVWVHEGRCYYFGKISWEGNTLFSEDELASLLEFSEGDVFSEEKFNNSRNEKLGGAYYDRGYIYAQIYPEEALRNNDIIDIHFVIDKKNPVRIRNIKISGNTRTKERVIRRALMIRPGDIFSKELLLRSHRELMVLNYFSVVEPNVHPVNDEELDLSFKVEERSTDTANLSAGWSELDRLIGSIGLGMNNFFGNGQQLSLDWNFGRYYRSFSLSFNEPWFRSTPTLVGLSIFDTKRDAYYIGYSQKSRGFSVRLGRRFHWPDNFFRGDWVYRLDQTELSNFSDYYRQINPNNIVNEDWPLTSSGITQIISRNSLDQVEFPTQGSRVSLSTEIAGGPLGGNVGYHKHIFSAEYFLPIVRTRLILLTRAQAGFMGVLNKSGKIPYLEYFFMGGSGLSRAIPLRGYDDPLAGGQYYYEGGKTMLQTTVELRFPIIMQPTTFGLMFAEVGNTWTDLAHTDPFSLRRSLGIGARIFMPMVGIIGFDYAYGFDYIDPDTGDKTGKWKTHFVFGRSF